MPLKPADYEIQAQSNYLRTKALAAIVYLCAVRRGIEHPERLEVNDNIDLSLEIVPLLESEGAIHLLRYVWYAFEIDDREMLSRHIQYLFSWRYVYEWFPTSRERFEAREWLVALFVAMDLDLSRLDGVFPQESPST